MQTSRQKEYVSPNFREEKYQDDGLFLSTWIKRRRKALDLTQQQLAERASCVISLIFKIESDGCRPSCQITELLFEILIIPFDQHDLFMKVARQEKGTQRLETNPPLDTPVPASPSQSSISPLPLLLIPPRRQPRT